VAAVPVQVDAHDASHLVHVVVPPEVTAEYPLAQPAVPQAVAPAAVQVDAHDTSHLVQVAALLPSPTAVAD